MEFVMQTKHIQFTRENAQALFRDYKKCLHYAEPIDREIMRAYELLGKGRLIIKALESIVAAGLNNDAFPKLAICRATASKCFLHLNDNGRATMSEQRHPGQRAYIKRVISFPERSFKVTAKSRYGFGWDAEAIVPPAPLHLRPKRGMQNYHILWEAEWTRTVPHDPYLIRRIGSGDMWLVVAMWQLSEVERAALSSRIGV
jgi:hypothetical protein